MARGPLLAIALLAAGSAACSEAARPGPAQPSAELKEAAMADQGPRGAPVAGLPFSQGRSFASLDDYLAFLQTRGAYDVPWYREIRPGVYELVTRRPPGAPPKLFTRAELARKYGFPG